MGDRGNIVIREDWGGDEFGPREAVFLYSHWGGEELPETLRAALSRNERWNDDSYLARILFQEMIGDDHGATGFGISSQLTDNDHDLIVLRGERVYLLRESVYREAGFAGLDDAPACEFSDVANADAPLTWEALEALTRVTA